MSATDETLRPPKRGHFSATAIRTHRDYTTAVAIRPGDTFTIRRSMGFVILTFTQDERRVDVSIHDDGIPALIAELQRLTA